MSKRSLNIHMLKAAGGAWARDGGSGSGRGQRGPAVGRSYDGVA
jgi:hypothetical protein